MGKRTSVVRRVCVAMAVIATAVFGTTVATPSSVQAATEIDWYSAIPGYIRTDLQARSVAANPAGDRLYVDAGVGGERRLMLIDFADYTVLEEVPIEESAVLDLAVSPDGAAVFTLDEYGTIVRFDAVTLDVTMTIVGSGATATDRLALAPGDNDVLALASGKIFRDGVEIDVSAASFLGASAFGFGASADEVFALGSVGEPLRFEIVGSTLTLVSSGPGVLGDPSGTTEFVAGQVQFWGQSSMIAVDPVTLLEVASTSYPTAYPVHNGNDRRIYTHRSNYEIMKYDGSPSVGVFTLPIETNVRLLTALDDGMVLGVEYFQGGSGAYLVELDTTLLASGYGDYHPVTPERIVDTRYGIGVEGVGRIAPGETIEIAVAGEAEVPDTGVLAATLNVTVTEPTGSGFVKVWPTGFDRPEVSNVNYTNGQTVANGVTVTLGRNGGLQVFNHDESAAHVLIDVTGYYSNRLGERGARYVTGERRVLDTRNATQGRFGKLGQGEYLDIYVPSSGDPDVPIGEVGPDGEFVIGAAPGTVAAVLNVTVANATAFSFVKVTPRDDTGDDTSTINFYPGDLRSNMTVVQVSSGGWVRLYNHVGTVDLIVDVIGHYLTPEEEIIDQVGRYYPTIPFRQVDTRESSPFEGDGSVTPGSLLLMPGARGWTDIVNVTVTEPTADGYVSVSPWDGVPRPGLPGSSSVNFVRNQTVANGAYATANVGYSVANPLGNTHVVIDVFGYLTPEVLESIDAVFSPQELRREELGRQPLTVGAGRP